jgi:glutaredoxin
MIRVLPLLFMVVFPVMLIAQNDDRIKIEEEKMANRLMLYAVNVSDNDLDVLVTVEGTNFRQSRSKPRLMRIPSLSRVHVHNLMLDKKLIPNYTVNVTVNDSLSRRALRKPATRIQVDPSKPITFFITEKCSDCDSLNQTMENGKYKFSLQRLAEKPEVKKQLSMAVSRLDTITRPVFTIGGKLYKEIGSYDELLKILHEQ